MTNAEKLALKTLESQARLRSEAEERHRVGRVERDAEYERVRALGPAYEERLRANPHLRGGVVKPRPAARRTAPAEPRVREVDFDAPPPDDLPREVWPEFFR